MPLYLTARGLTTSPMAIGHRTIDAELDLIDHVLVLRTSDGAVERCPLGGAVADFYADVMGAFVNRGITTAAAAGCATLITGLNAYLIVAAL